MQATWQRSWHLAKRARTVEQLLPSLLRHVLHPSVFPAMGRRYEARAGGRLGGKGRSDSEGHPRHAGHLNSGCRGGAGRGGACMTEALSMLYGRAAMETWKKHRSTVREHSKTLVRCSRRVAGRVLLRTLLLWHVATCLRLALSRWVPVCACDVCM